VYKLESSFTPNVTQNVQNDRFLFLCDFSSGVADSRYFINGEDNKLKAIKGKVGRVQGIKMYRKSNGKDPPVLTLGVGWR
jgi:hypothetical protein